MSTEFKLETVHIFTGLAVLAYTFVNILSYYSNNGAGLDAISPVAQPDFERIPFPNFATDPIPSQTARLPERVFSYFIGKQTVKVKEEPAVVEQPLVKAVTPLKPSPASPQPALVKASDDDDDDSNDAVEAAPARRKAPVRAKDKPAPRGGQHRVNPLPNLRVFLL